MNRSRRALSLVVASLFLLPVAHAENGHRPWQFWLNAYVAHDDNYGYLPPGAEDASFQFGVQPNLAYDIETRQSLLRLGYKPTFTWWDDREDDDSDFWQDFYASINHEFSPRLRMRLKNTYRQTEDPGFVIDSQIVRQNGDYDLNHFQGELTVETSERSVVDLLVGHSSIRYDNPLWSDTLDADALRAGATFGYQVVKDQTTVFGRADYSDQEYEDVNRNSDGYVLGLGVQHAFSADFEGVLVVGNQSRDFENAETADASETYVQMSGSYSPSPRSRLHVGVNRALDPTDVDPYVIQAQDTFFVDLDFSPTARTTLFVGGSYYDRDFDAKEAIPGSDVTDGTEDHFIARAGATYDLLRDRYIDVSYQYNDLSSDVRSSFTRNYVRIGMRFRL